MRQRCRQDDFDLSFDGFGVLHWNLAESNGTPLPITRHELNGSIAGLVCADTCHDLFSECRRMTPPVMIVVHLSSQQRLRTTPPLNRGENLAVKLPPRNESR
jgi:hypothetical protein